jgi:hypothetical protein
MSRCRFHPGPTLHHTHVLPQPSCCSPKQLERSEVADDRPIGKSIGAKTTRGGGGSVNIA